MDPQPFGCNSSRKSDRDPRLYARLHSKPFHAYRFLTMLGGGVCETDIVDKLTGAEFGKPDAEVEQFLLTTRDSARGALLNEIGATQFAKLTTGSLTDQAMAITRLLSSNPTVRSVFLTAAMSRRTPVRKDRMREVKFEVPPEQVLDALLVSGRPPPVTQGVVGMLTVYHANLYGAAIDGVNSRVQSVPGEGTLRVVKHRMLSIERTKDSQAFHIVMEVVLHRSLSPYGFHLELKCITLNTTVLEIYEARMLGQVMSDQIFLMGEHGDTNNLKLPYSYYFFGADDRTLNSA